MIRFISFCTSSMRLRSTPLRTSQKSAGLAVFLDKLCNLEDHRSEQRGKAGALLSNGRLRQVSLAPAD